MCNIHFLPKLSHIIALTQLKRWIYLFEITNLENRSVGIKCIIYILQSPPGGVVAKNPPASAGDSGAMGSTPELRRSPGEGNGNPLQCSCLGNSMDRGAWWAAVHGVARNRMWLSMYTLLAVNNQMSLDSWDVLGCLTWPRRLLVNSSHAASTVPWGLKLLAANQTLRSWFSQSLHRWSPSFPGN